ncbi:MAG: HD domain-containing protein [Thermoanaerobaculales bacterium]|jgi:(p)ppGpp synthase/HD superfamily hydrolase|nr:HD domain-containing protein [Thermoanaerobaculales bacterium]
MTTNRTDAAGHPMYSAMVEAAIRLASQGHYHQFRKRNRGAEAEALPGRPLPDDHVPYITHLMGTVTILARLGAKDEVLAAAALHDYLEDVPDPDGRRRIIDAAGPKVLELVLAVTENKRPGLDGNATWKARKSEQLARIESMPREAVLIKGADTLHNLITLVVDLEGTDDPRDVWDRFNAPRDEQIWYFTGTLAALKERLGDHPLTLELAQVIRRLVA